MSLNQFLGNNSGGNAVDGKILQSQLNMYDNLVFVEKENIKVHKDGDFFEKVKQEAKNAVTKDDISHKRKKRDEKIDENITIAQYQVKTTSCFDRQKVSNRRNCLL